MKNLFVFKNINDDGGGDDDDDDDDDDDKLKIERGRRLTKI